MKKAGIVLGIVIGLVLCCFLYRFIRISIVKSQHRITSEKGIDEVVVKKIGGIDQYFYIRGQNRENPVILMVNGGMPMIPMLHLYQYDWEDSYTIVNWDRRGSGETYFLNQKDEEQVKQTMTDEVLIQDIGEAVDFVSDKFGERRVVLLADSQGTTLAARYVMEHPEKILCYIGSAQITDMAGNMELCAADMIQRAQSAGNEKDAEKLKELAGHTREEGAFLKSFNPLAQYAGKYISGESAWDSVRMYVNGLSSPYFPIAHLSYYFKSDELSMGLLPYLETFRLADYGARFQVPVFFILGENDGITKYSMQDYYQTVDAPEKQLYYIPDAGHDALQQKPEEFYQKMNEAIRQAMQENT